MAISWTKEYDGAAEPDSGGAYDWTLAGTDYSTSDGSVLTIDSIGQGANSCYYIQSPAVDFDSGVTLEARVKHVQDEGAGYLSIAIMDGTQNERVRFRVYDTQIWCEGTAYNMDTTTDYHIYRIVVEGTRIDVYVDGIRRIENETVYSSASPNQIRFGDENSADGINTESIIDYFNYILGSAIGCFNKTATDGITLSDSNHETYPVITARHMRPKVVLIKGRL